MPDYSDEEIASLKKEQDRMYAEELQRQKRMPDIIELDITDYVKEVTFTFEFKGETTECIWRRDLEGTEVSWSPKKPQWAKDMETESELEDFLEDTVNQVW
jgi:hypothetical protein